MFVLALASCVARKPSSASTSTSIQGDYRHYADALEDLEREMTRVVAGPGRRGGDGDWVGDGGRYSRSTTTTTTKPKSSSRTTLGSIYRRRQDSSNDDAHDVGYESHDRLWGEGEGRIEELGGMSRRRASQRAHNDRIDGRETLLDEEDLALLSKRMAAMNDVRMGSVDNEMEGGVSEWMID